MAMGSTLLSLLPLNFPALHYSNSNSLTLPTISQNFPLHSPTPCPSKREFQFIRTIQTQHQQKARLCPNSISDSNEEDTVEVLRVPDHWLEPSIALQESEWLRVALHKWLDDEYCPEPTNVDISKVAADSYYQSLLNRTTDLGEILLKMVRELQSISYQESFHGAFSSANAAVSLIAQRIEEN